MATPTYDLLDSTTLSSSASSVTFSSIDQSYRDLVLVVEAKGATGNVNFNIQFNSDTGNNYNQVGMSSIAGGISTVSSNVDDVSLTSNASTTEAALITLQFLDYSATDKHKSGLARNGRPGSSTNAQAFRYASTSAITSIRVFTGFDNYASGATFHLYGVAA